MPDSEYTPTLGEVRNNMAFGLSAAVVMPALAQNIDWPNPADRALGKAEFDRWLASHETAIRATALDEAAEVVARYAKAPARTALERIIAGDIEHRIRALKEER